MASQFPGHHTPSATGLVSYLQHPHLYQQRTICQDEMIHHDWNSEQTYSLLWAASGQVMQV